MNKFYIFLLLFFFNCQEGRKEQKDAAIPVLTLEKANQLATLPLHCVNTEFPNRLSQTLGGQEDLKTPKELHPAFYGCFDWHSSVHGHWSLVYLLKHFPKIDGADEIRKKMMAGISSANIEKEVLYFQGEHNQNFERTYGWGWLLKLAEELYLWDDNLGKLLGAQLQPLTDLIVKKYIDFLPKLRYPIRVGEHANTAFGLSFAWDYATTVGHDELKSAISQKAKEFYANDKNCPLSWEPGGQDFLSPCLEEAALMKRVLSKNDFKIWCDEFLPQLKDQNFTMLPGQVSDRKDGTLVHLDGVNFSRAWSLITIAKDLSAYSHLNHLAYQHINYSLPGIVDNNYEGTHWLGTFAIYALEAARKSQTPTASNK